MLAITGSEAIEIKAALLNHWQTWTSEIETLKSDLFAEHSVELPGRRSAPCLKVFKHDAQQGQPASMYISGTQGRALSSGK